MSERTDIVSAKDQIADELRSIIDGLGLNIRSAAKAFNATEFEIADIARGEVDAVRLQRLKTLRARASFWQCS